MRFQWYIIDLEEGIVKGTNDIEVVQKSGALTSDAHVVLTAQHGFYFLGSTRENPVEEMTFDEDEPEED